MKVTCIQTFPNANLLILYFMDKDQFYTVII